LQQRLLISRERKKKGEKQSWGALSLSQDEHLVQSVEKRLISQRKKGLYQRQNLVFYFTKKM
jgi:hypothetical protein